MAPENSLVIYEKLAVEIRKIYERIKKSKEKWHLINLTATKEEDLLTKSIKTTYHPSRGAFEAARLKEYGREGSAASTPQPWSYKSENQDKTWVGFIKYLKEKYGLGPEVSNRAIRPYQAITKNPRKLEWWRKKRTHISEHESYYIVPLVYEDIQKNVALSNHRDGDTNKLKVSTLLQDTNFIDGAKGIAIRKLARDLGKAVDTSPNSEHMKGAKQYGFVPPDTATTAGGWHIVPRKRDYQNLWLKVMFDRGWVDALPSKVNPEVDFSNIQHEVMLFIKDLKFNLERLKEILYHFHSQFLRAEGLQNIRMNFDAECTAGKMSKVYQDLNDLLVLNDKPELETLEKTNAAIQLGFSSDYKLQYVSFSEVPDCLCDKENINAYILKAGLEDMKSKSPFGSSTVNSLLYYLPEIKRKYFKHSVQGVVSKKLFATEQSWLSFVQTYIYPSVDISYSSMGTKYDGPFAQSMAVLNAIKIPTLTKLATGTYLKSPTALMSPDIRKTILASSNVMNIYAGDDSVQKALSEEFHSITSLYDRLLNKIPIAELVKLTAGVIIKCLPYDEYTKTLCKSILKTLPLIEIRTTLYPCLRELGTQGELAIASLEEKVSGRAGLVYNVAVARYPEKFTKNPAEEAITEADLAEVTSLYCSDPAMQKKLGRSPDDFDDELAAWAQGEADKAICDCILSIHGPATQLLEYAQETYEDVVDEIESLSKNRPALIEQQSTLAINKIIQPFKDWSKPRDKLRGWGESLVNGLEDMFVNLIMTSALILIKYAKQEILGNLQRDLCNTSKDEIFGFKPLSEFIMESPLYEDDGQEQIWDKLDKLKAKHLFNHDIQALWDGIVELDEMFSPSELKRLLTTPCDDSSADDLFSLAATVFMSNKTKKEIQDRNEGMPIADFEAAADRLGSEEPTLMITGPAVPSGHDFMSTGQAHDFFNDLGKLVDPSALDDSIEEYEALKKKLASFLCEPSQAAIEILKEGIESDDADRAMGKDRESLRKDITSALSLLDPRAIEDQFPPLFCGPCNPRQVGQKPLMPSQTDPTQLFMFDRLNAESYKLIDQIFNSNLSVYKNIITETGGVKLQVDMVDKWNSNTGFPSDPDTGKDVTPTKFYSNNTDELISEYSDTYSEANNQYVAGHLRQSLKDAVKDSSGLTQIQEFDFVNNFAAFAYKIPNSNWAFHMIFNYNDINDRDYIINPPGLIINVSPLEIKLIIIDEKTGIIDFQWPPEEGGELISKSFDLDDVGTQIAKYYLENKHASKKLGDMLSTDAAANVSKQFFPIVSSYLFETLILQAAARDLFRVDKFSSIPLTNAEAKEKCIPGIGTTPLLDTEKLRNQIEKTRKELECVIGIFDTPDSLQVANVYGLYTLMIKVCVIEEYLKNIFMFSFVKIGDILETEAYMTYFIKNLKELVESSIGFNGYENLLEYSAKIINGRQQIEELDENSPLTEEFAYKEPHESLEILIKEIALETGDILDERVRTHVDPNWKDQFIDFTDTDSKFPNKKFAQRIVEYFTIPNYWNAALYPVRKYTASALTSLTSGVPSFAKTVNAKPGVKFDVSMDTTEPFPEGWNGGLLNQPYIRLKSVFEDYEDKESALQQFWSKFVAAFKYKVIQENNFQVAASTGKIQHVHKAPIITNSNSGHFQLDTAGQPKKIDDNTSDALRRVLEDLINKINGEISEGIACTDSGSTFYKFFTLFFNPLGGPDMQALSSDIHSYSNDPESEWGQTIFGQRSIFERIVSSFTGVPPMGMADVEKYQIGAKNPFSAYKNIMDTTGVGPTTMWNAFFYWEHYPYGVVPPAGNEFINRGIIDFDTAGLGANWEIQVPSFVDFPYGQGGLKVFKLSTLSIFARAKEVMIGYQASDSNTPEAKVFGQNIGGASLLGNLSSNKFLKKIREFMQDLNFELYTSDIDDPTEDNPEVTSYYYECLFWKFMQEIVMDAPFDHWFDISMGMRMNLIIPIVSDEEDKANLTQYFNLLEEIIDIELGPADKKYLTDKTFLISAPPYGSNTSKWQKSDTDKQWGCIPLEYVEYDLREYFTSFTNEGTTSQLDNPWEQLFVRRNWKSIAKNDSTWSAPHSLSGVVLGNNDTAKQLVRHKYSDIKAFFSQAEKENGVAHNSRLVWNDDLDGKGHIGDLNYKSKFQEADIEIPTFWTVCKLINQHLNEFSPTDVAEPNQYRKDILKVLKKQLVDKIIGAGVWDGAPPHKLFDEVFPIQEATITASFFYRYFMEASYPALNDLFTPTKQTINNFVTQMIATINGDYQYLDEIADSSDFDAPHGMNSPASYDIAKQFMLLAVQMGANMIDPTWKTPWFFPGPLTPVGVLAKILSRKSEKDKEPNKLKEDLEKKNSLADEDPC